MASLIPKDGVLYQSAEVAPSPSKDFWQLLVTREEVVIRWWKISLRHDSRIFPGENRQRHEDFLEDYKAQSDILMVFGEGIHNYVIRLAQGQMDYMSRLSDQVIMQIVEYLDLDDIARLSVVSKQFNKICRSDELWKRMFLNTTHQKVASPDLQVLAKEIGWRQVYFTGKLQLQVQLHRRKKKSPKDVSEYN